MKVLIVDDDDLVLRAMARLISRAGHDVVAVDGVEAATKMLEYSRFDAVISDWDMTSGGGRAVYLAALGRGVRPQHFAFHSGRVDLPCLLSEPVYDGTWKILKPASVGEFELFLTR